MPELSESQRAWWYRDPAERDVEDPTAHEKLHAVISYLTRYQARKRDFLLWASMYTGSLPPNGLQWNSYTNATPGVARRGLALNVSRSVVEAAVSRVFAKSKPDVAYVTEGGDYERQHNAQQLERGVDGVFAQDQDDEGRKASDVFIDAGRDGCVFGTGPVCIEADHDERRVRIERHMPWETIVDDGEAAHGPPMSLYTSRYYDKYRLIYLVRHGFLADGTDEELAAKANLIERLGEERDDDADPGYMQVGMRIKLDRAWRKPSGKEAGDGRYVVAVENCTLIDRTWGSEGEKWPYAFYRWSKPLIGFYGQGTVELGSELQAEINKLVRRIQEGHHLITGAYLVHESSKVRAQHINNDLAKILKWAGDPSMKPEYVTPAIISPEVYSHLWALVAKYYELTGINQQTAQAQKPAGLDSGEAQRVYADQQTETLLEKGERYQQFVLKCADLTTRAAKELAEEGPYEVRSFQDEGFETIDWRELDDPNGYECKMAPISSLPGTPSGRLALGNDLMKMGDFDAADMLEVIGMPDILQRTTMKQSSRKLVEKRLGEMIRDGIRYEPHQMLNLAEAVIIAEQMYCHAELRDVPDERLELVRDFIEACRQELQKAQPPAPPPMLAPGAHQGNLLGPGMQGVVAGPPGAGGPPPAAAPPPAQAA